MTKQAGFLTKRLGTIVIYCNRTKGGLWYTSINGVEKNLDADGIVSFQSAENGLRGLSIYKTVRYEEEKIKLALILEGEDSQVYKFETGAATAFGRGMLWAIAHMADNDVTGQIGINPTPGDATKMDSKNVKSLLFCNMFVNGVELPYLPSGNEAKEMDWQEIAHKALCRANRCAYPIEQVPESQIFWDKDAVWETDTTERKPQVQAKTQQPVHPTTQGRSGVTYPQQAVRTQPAPAQVVAAIQKPVASVPESPKIQAGPEELNGSYVELMDYVVGEYVENNVALDEGRIDRFVERAKAANFEGLTLGRKHQIVSTLAVDLVETLQPTNKNISKLKAIITPGAISWEIYTLLSDLLMVMFVEIKHPPDQQPGSDDPIPF